MNISVFIATSLDGYIAREDGALDWLPQASDEDHGYASFFSSIDTLLMGRKTFETVLGFSLFPYPEKRVVVCSQTISQNDVPPELQAQVVVQNKPLLEVVNWLEAEGAQHVYADGGQLITGLLELGLVNQITLTQVPVLLGSGIRLFGNFGQDISLRHLETKSFHSGLVQSLYAVLHNKRNNDVA